MSVESDDDDFAVCLDGEGRVSGSTIACPETGFAVFDGLLSMRTNTVVSLRADCLLASWPMAKGSFWLPWDATPSNALEALALRIFQFHTERTALSGITAGAEWWANVSHSETIARKNGYGDIGFHFDKDEAAFELSGLFIHPVLSTVTYLSASGAPTVVVPMGISPDGTYTHHISPFAQLVPPAVGRHLRFDGRHLHGAPAALLPGSTAPYERVTLCAAACRTHSSAAGSHRVRRQGLTVSLAPRSCVNIWIGHKPGRCRRFTSVAPLGVSPTTGDMEIRLRRSSSRDAERFRAASSVVWQCHDDGATALEVSQTAELHTLNLPVPTTAVLRKHLASARVLQLFGSAGCLLAAGTGTGGQGGASTEETETDSSRPTPGESCPADMAGMVPTAAPLRQDSSGRRSRRRVV